MTNGACGGMVSERHCMVCGGIIKNKRNKKFCSYKCAGLYRQHYGICPVCGRHFKHSPSDSTTHTCGSDECKRKYRSQRTPKELIERAHEAIKTHPKTGHFETHHNAEEWRLISPWGEEYRFKNLALWIEGHGDLLPVSERTGGKVSDRTFYREITRLKSDNEKHVCLRDNYYGWRVLKEDGWSN